MLEALPTAAAGTTTHRLTTSKPHCAHGHGKPSLGRTGIHGELLKLGFTVSERTVSRYLPHRLATPSQTWRTFLANHFGSLAFASAVTSSFATSDDDVDLSVRRHARGGTLPLSGNWSIGLLRANRRLLACCVAQDQLHRRTRIRFSSGKDPPKLVVEPVLAAYGWRFLTSRDSILGRRS
jgi:hypothetical protein